MENKCNCGTPLSHNERYDAYYCSVCNQWVENKCSDLDCFYCKDRPDKPTPRKKNYKDHKCQICGRDFKSVRSYVRTCSIKCFNYSKSEKYWKDMRMGLKIDPHNPPPKFRRILKG